MSRNKMLYWAMCACILGCAVRLPAASYAEIDGLVLMEAEETDMDGDWQVKTAISGYTGSGYIEAGNSGTLQYPITFHHTGVYEFRWRVSAPHKTEHNDSYIRMTGPSVQIKSGGGSSCLNSGWAKVYGAGEDSWSWDSRNCDHSQKHVSFTIGQTGDYLFEIKQRSTQHKIDRIIMCDESRISLSEGKDLSRTPTYGDGYTPPPTPEAVSIDAVDFDSKGDFYVDGKYLAVDPLNDDDQKATATEAFGGVDGEYDITFYGVGEEDGESMYKLWIGGALVGEYQVPTTSEAFEEGDAFNHTWTGVTVNNGDEITVEATAHSNGDISEPGAPGGYAWSRGRWYQIDFIPAGSGGGTSDPTAMIEPAAGETIPLGATITLKGSGANLRWAYDANSDGLGEVPIGNGAEVQFEVPEDVSDPREITLILRGDNGTVERTCDLIEAATGLLSPAAAPAGVDAARGGIAVFTIDGRCVGRFDRPLPRGRMETMLSPGTYLVRDAAGATATRAILGAAR
jgi:hypothetical protein